MDWYVLGLVATLAFGIFLGAVLRKFEKDFIRKPLQATIDSLVSEQQKFRLRHAMEWSIIEHGDERTGPRSLIWTGDELHALLAKPETDPMINVKNRAWTIRRELTTFRALKGDATTKLATAVSTLRHDKRKGDKAIMETRVLIERVLEQLEPDENKRKALLFDAVNLKEKAPAHADA